MIESDQRFTPEWLWNAIDGGFKRVTLDVCTHPTNPMGCKRFYTEADDGLQKPWERGLNYCNPPYSRGQVIRWARKAYDEYQQGNESVVLTQADVSTGWFDHMWNRAQAVAFLKKRVGFTKIDGTKMPGAKFGSALWYFGYHRDHFRDVFDPSLANVAYP